MKNFKMYLGMFLIAALTITSCQNDTVSELPDEQADFDISKNSGNTTLVKYNYDYYGERFSVNYTIDNESGELLSTEGDLERAYALFPEGEGPQAVLFTNLPEDENPDEVQNDNSGFVEIDAEIFNSEAEMDAQVERYAEEAIPQEEAGADDNGRRDNTGQGEITAKGPCHSYSLSGSGKFRYYRHAYYNTEMTSLRRHYKRFFRNHWVGSSNNDQMSSLVATKPWNKRIYTRLYQHSCFNGRSIGFYRGRPWSGVYVRNLTWYTLSGALWWRTSWNDQVSSVAGWCW